jgi:hypothetical protein
MTDPTQAERALSVLHPPAVVAAEFRMKRMLYCGLMSILIGSITGVIVVNVVNIMYPEFDLDYALAIMFFSALTWAILNLLGMLSRRPT